MILNMAILVTLLESHISTMISIVCRSRTLRGRRSCFIWEQMLWKQSATRMRPGGMDFDSHVILFVMDYRAY